MTEAEHERVAITHDEAIRFLEVACRNWRHLGPLVRTDIDDVAGALTEFRDRALAIHLPTPAQPTEGER